ncbi:MAG: S46 family peptidase, partial [Myxococcales bacterium]|nr:S46 family peptidase [Myxococcales bacterium]
AKNTGTEPFAAPAKLLAAANGDKGPYRVEALGDVPLDFLADLDITGGNSGSATLNAKGELVGLAFDGNYEAIASNWMFIPGITRSIHVDIRFVLWVLDAVDQGDHLLTEMGVTPKIAATQAAPAEAAKPPAPAAAPAEPAKAPTASAAMQPTAPAVAG